MKKQNVTRKAREALRQVIDAACVARGEAQWMNGYRTGRYSAKDVSHDSELYGKELARYEICAQVEERLERCITRFVRIVRDNKPTKQPRRRTR